MLMQRMLLPSLLWGLHQRFTYYGIAMAPPSRVAWSSGSFYRGPLSFHAHGQSRATLEELIPQNPNLSPSFVSDCFFIWRRDVKVICRGLRKACEVAVARLDAVSVKPVDDEQVGLLFVPSFSHRTERSPMFSCCSFLKAEGCRSQLQYRKLVNFSFFLVFEDEMVSHLKNIDLELFRLAETLTCSLSAPLP